MALRKPKTNPASAPHYKSWEAFGRKMNTLSYYRQRDEEATLRAESANEPSIREFFKGVAERYENIAANLVRARRPTLLLRLDRTKPVLSCDDAHGSTG